MQRTTDRLRRAAAGAPPLVKILCVLRTDSAVSVRGVSWLGRHQEHVGGMAWQNVDSGCSSSAEW